jgi:hypothetical protein
VFFFKFTSDSIMPRIGNIRQSFDHAQSEHYTGIIRKGGAGISLLDPVERHPADRSSFCKDSHRYAPAPAGVTNVLAEFPQGADYRQWDWRRFSGPFHY